MFRTYEQGYKKYKPTLRLTCAVIAFVISIFEFGVALYGYLGARTGNFDAAIYSGIFAFHGLLTTAYFVGIIKQNECLLLPFLTIQLILVTSTGLLVMIWWIATLLTFFDLVVYGSLIESLSTSEFYCLIGVGLLIFFIILLKVSWILYRGYKRVELENIYRKRLDRSLARSISSTIPPTQV